MNLQNVQSLSWSKIEAKGKPPTPRHGHTMNSLFNLLVIFGGHDDSNNFLNDLIVYNTIDNEW
jgi:hypothetical protein